MFPEFRDPPWNRRRAWESQHSQDSGVAPRRAEHSRESPHSRNSGISPRNWRRVHKTSPSPSRCPRERWEWDWDWDPSWEDPKSRRDSPGNVGFWGNLGFPVPAPGPAGSFPGIPGAGWDWGSFSSKIHLFFFWLFFVFPGFLFPSGLFPVSFVGKKPIPNPWNFRRSPGRTGRHRQTFPREQEEAKSREKAGKEEEKRRKKRKTFPEGEVGEPLPNPTGRERFGAFPSSFPAAPFPRDRGPSLLQIPNFPSGKALWTHPPGAEIPRIPGIPCE